MGRQLRGRKTVSIPYVSWRDGRPRVRVGTAAEIEALLASADTLGLPFVGDGIVLGLFTGQRQGDRLAMQHDGLDEQGRYRFKQSKKGAIVAIKRAPWLKERLDAALERRRLRNAIYPRVLMDETCWLPLDRYRRCYSRYYETVREHAAQTVPSVASLTDQDLRDTAVTYMARGGATIPTICSVTGHSMQSATTILSHYLELNPELADEAIDAMVSYWERQLEQEKKNAE